jgi:hypothetical protein
MRGSSFECWQQFQPGWLDKPRELTAVYSGALVAQSEPFCEST